MLYSKIEGIGQPIVILHGFLGMSDNWKTIAANYAQEGFNAHILDLRNHGRSFHSNEFDYNLMVQDVFEYCEFHNLEKIFLLGHSMGGKVAMLFATNFPEKVEKLIIADIGPKYYPPHHQTILEGLNAVDFSKKPSRSQVEQILSNYISDFGTRQFLMKNLYWKTPEELAFRFNLVALTHNVSKIGTALPENAIFNNPTLFIRGGNSNYILNEDSPLILSHFPKANSHTIQDAGHWLHAEKPQEFFELTRNFLKK